ncbi:hypothetical protein J4401_05615 [Candidatus Woesearchaeota archaeon]|nr:hypothetical protein [Candidatus Woesearchaeota archaeon]
MKKRTINRFSLLFLFSFIFSFSLSFMAYATVLAGSVFLQDITDNATSKFNFSSRTYGNGHVIFDVYNDGRPMVAPINGAKILSLGHFSPDLTGAEFNTSFLRVPNSSFVDIIWSETYGTWPSAEPRPGDVVALLIDNSTYVALFFVEVRSGSNITFIYKYNNQAGNNTYGQPTGCGVFQDMNLCFSNINCEWDRGTCRQNEGGFDFPPAECSMLPRTACNGMDPNFCSWNANSGTAGLCKNGASVNPSYGFNCTAILNHSVCMNSTLTMNTGLCTWNGLECQINSSKIITDIPRPPVFTCSAVGYSDNKANCELLANRYYMPCGWGNTTNRCESLFIDFGKFEEMGDIGNEDTCKTMSGSWKTETTFDPITNSVSSQSWCEPGVNVKTFDKVGGGGGGGAGSFFGDAGQVGSCGRDCFACEFNGSLRWATGTDAQQQCQSSAAGCLFRNDSNAFNGYGWCNPAAGTGGAFSCETSCGECMLQPNATSACQNSPAGCRWDNNTNFCAPKGEKGCSQDCFQCHDSASCDLSPAFGGCSWENDAFFCKPNSGKFEVCYDGIDNDNNDKTDCKDFKCSSDPFCGGDLTDLNKCAQYSTSNTCASATGCNWFTEIGFSFCGPASEQCWRNDTFFTDQAACNNFNGGNTCVYKTGGVCGENQTLFDVCVTLSNAGACNTNLGCKWAADGFCDAKPIVVCEDNATLQTSQIACQNAGCVWQGGNFGGGFEGGNFQNCISPCIDRSITTQSGCEAADDNSPWSNGTCSWNPGFCEPKDFIGGCEENDGDYTACRANTNCNWFQDQFGGPMKDPNGSNRFENYLFVQSTWLAFGLQEPNLGGLNVSSYIVNRSGGSQLALEWGRDNDNAAVGNLFNMTRLRCNANILMQYNWTTRNCNIGTCGQYNGTATCGGSVVDYFFNNTLRSAKLEVMWRAPITELSLDANEGNDQITTITNQTTVKIDGLLNEHVFENSSARDHTNASRVRTSFGICDSKLTKEFFGGMDMDPPIPIAGDILGDVNSGTPYLDIVGLGVKKTPSAYMYGIPTRNISSSVICNGVPINGQSLGAGVNASKYYLYLDTNGIATGGCSPENDASLLGFEYLFKYVAQQDGTTGKLSETLLTQQCNAGSWVASSISFKSDKNKGCGFVSGPIFGIDKSTFTGKSDVYTNVSWRTYATSANSTGNSSSVTDSVGPGAADFKGINVELLDCSNPAQKDNAQCSKFKQFGMFPGEFGPACIDLIDNDGDGSTDCTDYDCKYDPFFCSGTFGIQENDKESPSIVWTKLNKKSPVSLQFIFGTNEPSNGTVRFYRNDSTCSTINETALDKALLDGDSYTNFKPHHVASVTGLSANTTYFYKLYSCDPSSNCALSSCSNVTTAAEYDNITFKVIIPSGWVIDIPSINLSNYSGLYALKASTENLMDMNITIKNQTTNDKIKLVGASIFEKLTINLSKFVSSSGLLGMDAFQFQSFKQKTGADKAVVYIPTSGAKNVLQHCDDDGANCKDVTSNVDCTFTSSAAECEVPDAIGLGFSTYKAVANTGGSSSSSSSSGGGGSSGGGSATPPKKNETAKVADKEPAKVEVPAEIVQEEIVQPEEKVIPLAEEDKKEAVLMRWDVIAVAFAIIIAVSLFLMAYSHKKK